MARRFTYICSRFTYPVNRTASAIPSCATRRGNAPPVRSAPTMSRSESGTFRWNRANPSRIAAGCLGLVMNPRWPATNVSGPTPIMRRATSRSMDPTLAGGAPA